MQVVILAGGLGTRLAEETDVTPKPMVRIGEDPILIHIMRHFAKYDHRDFVIAGGYKYSVIADYFKAYSDSHNQLTDGSTLVVKCEGYKSQPWTIKVVDTGQSTATGSRILRLKNLLSSRFFLTYGDGLSNVNLYDLELFAARFNKIATVTAVHPPARFGTLTFAGDFVTEFSEKSPQSVGWINGGFFLLKKEICDYIKDPEQVIFERNPLEKLTQESQLVGFKHEGFWHPMDTLRDKKDLEILWQSGNAPWLR